MTDQELMLLEMVAYMDKAYEEAEIETPRNPQSVADFVNQFSEEDLKKLDALNDKNCGVMYDKQWSALIREIKSNENLMSLQLVARNKESGSYCFADPGDTSGKAYVVFEGTVDGDEWKDNFQGLYETDTACQQEAREFVDGLPEKYSDITVVGHSKGGNKAQYVTITCDRVKYCISMDGQGFSQEFLDKYWAEINEKGDCIKNYSLSTDFVHILLFPIPGAKQIYCADDGTGEMRNHGFAHSPAAYFQFYQDGDGKWHIVRDGTGNANLYIVANEEEAMVYLHQFTCFLANTATMAEKKQLAEYFGCILAITMKGKPITYQGKVYNKDNLLELVFSDPDSAAILIAYLLKYIELSGLSKEQIRNLLECFGLYSLLVRLIDYLDEFNKRIPGRNIVVAGITGLLELLLRQLSDGKRDPIVESFLGFALDKSLSKYGLNAAEIWQKIERHYGSIPEVDISKATENKTARSAKVYNYSEAAYSAFINAANAIAANTFDSVAAWKSYSKQEWYGPLSIGLAVDGITYYYDHLADICKECKDRVDRIFDAVSAADAECASRMIALVDELSALTSKIRASAEKMA